MEDKYKWIKFNPRAVLLPKERRYVLVQLTRRELSGEDCGLPPTVTVGYLRRWSNRNNFFVTPGVSQENREVSHWCDCLGDNFNAPLWRGKQR